MTPHIAPGTQSHSHSRQLLRQLPLPEPAAGVQAYQRERELALAASPKKRENYERYLKAARGVDVDYLPIKLDIESISRCNLRCTMCVVSDWPKMKRAEDMSVDAFKALIDEQYGLVEIKLQGIGEPMMQGDDFFEMIRYARERHIWVRMATNATLLHLKDNYRKLVESGVNEIQISIDGADKAAYETIRRGADFERVIENCKLINAYCRQMGTDQTKMWTVVQRDNVYQLDKLVDLAVELGFKCQVFSLNLTDWGLDSWHTINQGLDVQDSLSTDFLFSLVERGERLGVTVRFWNVNEKYRVGDTKTLCPWPFERAYVGSDMRVTPCCFIGNPDVYQIGKALDSTSSFSDVWFGQEFREFRRSHLEGNLADICKGCYYQESHSGAVEKA
jgi:MoaA/NifB/PqqE/SkfB family radical SAM enzyme